MADVNIQLPSLTAATTIGDSDLLHVRQGSTDKKVLFSLLKSLVLNGLDANDLLTLLLTVDGDGSLLDADKLDGQEGSYYRNASNLNTGTVASSLLSQVKDYGGTDRQINWAPARFATSTTLTLTDSHLNNIVEITSGTGDINLYVPSAGKVGSLIQIVNATSTNHTLNTAGTSLQWLQGGALATGARTILPYSALTLLWVGGTTWRVWGNGLS